MLKPVWCGKIVFIPLISLRRQEYFPRSLESASDKRRMTFVKIAYTIKK